jgi:hypothetical protein
MNTNEEIYSDIYFAPTKIIFGGKLKIEVFLIEKLINWRSLFVICGSPQFVNFSHSLKVSWKSEKVDNNCS